MKRKKYSKPETGVIALTMEEHFACIGSPGCHCHEHEHGHDGGLDDLWNWLYGFGGRQ
ncbi:MAG: hypothetical protein ACM3QZ_09985 [Solirubrobacterales bacterium]